MLKKDYIEMIKQDMVTDDNKMHQALLEVFIELLSKYPSDTNINSELNVAECYKEMEFYARKNSKNNGFVFTKTEVLEFVRYYLKLDKLEYVVTSVKLEDFI